MSVLHLPLSGLKRPIAALLIPAALILATSGVATAAANRTANGSGSTIEFYCGNGQILPANIQFNAQKSKGTVSGFANVFGPAVSKGIQITGGNVNNNSFSLTGFTYSNTCGTSTSTLTQQATLTGDCGTGVTIHYEDTGGQRGSFVGNVACS